MREIIFLICLIVLCANILRYVYGAIVLIFSKKVRNRLNASTKVIVINTLEICVITYALITLIIEYYK